MRVVIIGLGIQGEKRRKILDKKYLVATVDPINKKADFKNINDVPINTYDSCFVCVPDYNKKKIINFCIKNNKNVLVEKPLIFKEESYLKKIEKLCNSKKIVFYTAYNHRFEPNLINVKKIIKKKTIGDIYFCKLFYGNGTAKLVKNSIWKDNNSGVLADLGSHLIDLCLFFFNDKNISFKYVKSKNFENKSPDFFIINSSNTKIFIQLEMTLCMWKNSFNCEIIGKKGSIHINNLCKWGASKISIRKRVFPSGKPKEINKVLKMKDPTWNSEHLFFKKLIEKKLKNNLDNDKYINNTILNIKKHK